MKRATDTCRPGEDARIAREDPRRNGEQFQLGPKNYRSNQRSERSVTDLPDNFERIIY